MMILVIGRAHACMRVRTERRAAGKTRAPD